MPTIDPVDGNWHDAALDACRESLARIERLFATDPVNDRESAACLDAVRRSLEWVLTEPASEDQIAQTVQRANRAFNLLATRAAD
ncbi:MAG: hypothetical protein R3E68_17365 [Burkholderiaceae bacterium]